MWRTCRKCKNQFFRGGTKRNDMCEQCRYNIRKNKRLGQIGRRKYKNEASKTDVYGRVTEYKEGWPKMTCVFCKEEFEAPNKTRKYCQHCENNRPNYSEASICIVCGEIYWAFMGSKKTCSDACQQMIRSHQECIVCGERFTADSPPRQKFCNKLCRHNLGIIEKMRRDRDSKGNMYSIVYRYNKIKSLDVKREYLEEFRRDLDESENNDTC